MNQVCFGRSLGGVSLLRGLHEGDQKGTNQRGTQLEDPPEVPTQEKAPDIRASEEQDDAGPGPPFKSLLNSRRQLLCPSHFR